MMGGLPSIFPNSRLNTIPSNGLSGEAVSSFTLSYCTFTRKNVIFLQQKKIETAIASWQEYKDDRLKWVDPVLQSAKLCTPSLPKMTWTLAISSRVHHASPEQVKGEEKENDLTILEIDPKT